MERIDVAVVGGGVVGLAAASAVAQRGHSTCLFEQHARYGLEASTHNSGVVHAGIYYPADSLKARLCVDGRERLYRFCHDHAIPAERCGKLIVATDWSDVGHLEQLAEQGRRNGVENLDVIDGPSLRRLEPHVRGAAAIWSPSTGIVEAEGLVRTLSRVASRDVALLPGTRITGGAVRAHGIELKSSRERLIAKVVVNAAGLYADELSSTLGGDSFRIYPVWGEYAEIQPRARHLVRRPVYPIPHRSGHSLGVHLTRTTWGSVMVGPTARYQTDKRDYEGARQPIATLHESARMLIPSLELADLRPGGTGIRARPAPSQQAFTDFIIRADARVPRLIHAAGIDSPGLTACLSIAQMVAGLVDDALD